MGVREEHRVGSGPARLLLATLLFACATAFAMDTGPGVHIVYSESLRLDAQVGSSGGTQKSALAASRKLAFDAYGKRFNLSLSDNTRLSSLVQHSKGAAASSLQLYQGALDGIAESWVRLAVRDNAVRGMIWDGAELYVIESATDVRAELLAHDGASDTIIFKLSDTLLDPSANFCASDEQTEQRKGDDAYAELIGELKSGPVMMQAADAEMRIEIAALGDAAFLQRFANQQQARDEILVRLNNVDGIFSSQLGLEVQVPSVDVADQDNDPFTSTTSAAALLSELGRLRKNSSQLRSRGLTHLFTGRSLDGSTVGIAYLDSACHQEYGVGLTEVTNRGAWIEALISAHEIGHNFGAVHDGQGTCASTPQYSFLMSPSVSGSRSTFSECSLNQMRARIASASCVVDLPPADLAVPSQLSAQRYATARTFEWELTLTNNGGATARNSRVEILIPAAITVVDAYVPGGTCTTGAGIVFCQLGDLAGGSRREVHLDLRSELPTATQIAVTAMSQNDSQTSNNTVSGAVVIDHEADVSIALQSPSSALAASGFQVAYSVANLSAQDANNVDVSIDLPMGMTAGAMTLPNGTCTQQSATVLCKLATLQHGASVSGTVMLTAQAAGSESLRAKVSGSYIDPVSSNDSAEQAIAITAAPAQIQSASPSAVDSAASSGGGGGGSTGAALLAALACLASLRLRSSERVK